MATLADYIKNLREQQKPQPKPTPIDEETEQKAEAYDYLTGRGELDE